MNHLLSILYILTFTHVLIGQWHNVSTEYFLDRVYSVQAVSANTVWGLGVRGTIVKSTDGGETWVIQKPNISVYLNRMTFTGEMNGYITSPNGYLHRTTDGGLTWNSQIIYPGLNLTTIQFLNPSLGYISGSTGAILKTTDGGDTWTHIPTIAGTYQTIAFYNERIGMIAYDYGKTVRTTDGGATWLIASTGFSFSFDHIRDIQWLTAGKAFAIDGERRMFVTADTGRTWQIKTLAASFNVRSMHFIDSMYGFIVDFSSKTAKTTDGGQTFEFFSTPGGGDFPEDIFVYDTTRVYIAGPKYYVYRTTDGGATWGGFATQQDIQLHGVTVYSTSRAFVVGSHGMLGQCYLTAINLSWKQSGTRKNLFAVAFSTESKAIVVGEEGIVIYSENSNLNDWTVTNTGFENNLYSLAVYPGTNKVFAVGEGGTILRSLDFGITWQQLISGVSVRLNAIKFFDPTTLIAVGNNGVALRTTDDGITWHQLPVNTTKNLFSVTGTATNRLISGESGLVLRSSNNGDVWHKMVITDSSDITGIASGTQNSARLVTQSGIIYNTTNAGQSWSRELINPALSFKRLEAYSWSAMAIIFNKVGLFTHQLSVPVELTSFTASVSDKNITLEWSTASEANNQGFEIQRSSDGETWLTIGFKPGTGTSTETNIYNFSDQAPLTGTNHYRLKQIDYDGTSEIFQTVSAKFLDILDYSLMQNYPNPFNPVTMISYSIPASGMVQLKIYNMIGEEVVTLINEEQVAGRYQIRFNGSRLASGTYLYRITVNSGAGLYTQSRKMIILK